jgi:hypothetical protein
MFFVFVVIGVGDQIEVLMVLFKIHKNHEHEGFWSKYLNPKLCFNLAFLNQRLGLTTICRSIICFDRTAQPAKSFIIPGERAASLREFFKLADREEVTVHANLKQWIEDAAKAANAAEEGAVPVWGSMGLGLRS